MWSEFADKYKNRIKKDRPWNEYPVGTKAFAVMGGHWIRVDSGWKWFCGSTFPTPGGDANLFVELPVPPTTRPGCGLTKEEV